MIMATHKESFVVRNLAPVLISQTIPLAGEGPFFPSSCIPELEKSKACWPSFILFANFFLQGQPNGNTLHRHYYVDFAPVEVRFKGFGQVLGHFVRNVNQESHASSPHLPFVAPVVGLHLPPVTWLLSPWPLHSCVTDLRDQFPLVGGMSAVLTRLCLQVWEADKVSLEGQRT